MITSLDIAKAQTSLFEFTKLNFKYQENLPFIENWHHHIICDTLEKVLIGQIKNLVINIPPRYSKTEIAIVNFMAWSLGLYPDSEFIHASYSKMLASENSYNTRKVVDHPFYKEVFPHTRLSADSTAKADWKTTAGGKVYAVGAGGTITGYGAGKMRETEEFGGAILIDDPLKADEANSEVVRQGVNDWYMSTMKSRTNSKLTPKIVIMQRLHEDDLAGFLLRGDSGEKFDHLILPAITDEGEAMWDYKHTIDDLRAMEKAEPYMFSGQYMQSPSPLGGGTFKEEWWKYYDVLPNIEYKIITADTAQKTGQHNDFSVFQCWGYYEGEIYLIDQLRGKWEAPELVQRMVQFFNKHNVSDSPTRGKLRAIYIEDKVSGTGLVQDLRRTYKLPVIAVPRQVDKVTRANDSTGYISSGYLHLPKNAVWLADYVTEFSRFTPTMAHSHDDQIDPTLDAIEILLRKPMKRGGAL